MTRRKTQTKTGQSRGEDDAFFRENGKASATHMKKLPLYFYVDFQWLTKNKIYLLRGNFQQIPCSVVVKQMYRESNANSIGMVGRPKKKKEKEKS